MLIVGPSGVGKSHLSQALGWEACKRGYDVVYTSCAKVLASLAAGRAESGRSRGHGSYDKRLHALTRPDLLILDDFGLKPLRQSSPEDMYDIINERYEKSATIITRDTPLRGCNHALNEFPQLFGDPLLARNTPDGRGLPLRGGVPAWKVALPGPAALLGAGPSPV